LLTGTFNHSRSDCKNIFAGNCNRLSAYDYIDVVGVWFKRPLSRQQLSWVNSLVARPLYGEPFLRNRRARFDPRYCQYQRWHQPQHELLQWLAARDDTLINYVEIARDFVPDDEDDAPVMSELFSRSLVQHRHCKRETWLYGNGNGYSGGRYQGLTFGWYGDRGRVSKITGEEAFHLEARLAGAAVLRRYGIGNATDLLHLDHNAFWERMWERNIALYDIDLEKLGRWYKNKREGTKRQKPLVLSTCNYNSDKAVGAALFHSLGYAGNGYSIQGVFDCLGREAPFVKHEQREMLTMQRTNARSYAPKSPKSRFVGHSKIMPVPNDRWDWL